MLGTSTSSPTVSVVSAGATAGNLTQAIWAAFLIEEINAEGGNVPLTLNNVENVERWMTAENKPTDWAPRNNPLNASLGTTASDGTAGYANLTAAAQYTAKMILQKNMSGIYQALASNAPPAVFSAAVVKSPWAGSRYGVAAAGAPAKYIVPGRGLDYIANIALPTQTSVGTIIAKLPADSGAVVPASPTPLAPGVSGVNEGGNLGGGWLGDLTHLLDNLASPSWWLRVGMGALGVFLFTTGLMGFISTTKPGERATQDIGEATKAAATAAVAA